MSAERVEKKEQPKGFKRINFFKGFLTTEKDWNEAESYHVEKRKLHNRLLHAPGVVLGYQGDLRVMARARGDLSVEVQTGYAIDGQGNDLVLSDATIKNVNPEEYRLPQTLYFVLRFAEELSDFIAYKENLEYKGHRRWQEMCMVEISQTEPDLAREVEVGRVFLEKGATRIRDARDANDPRANEIDMRFRPVAGIAGSMLSPMLKLRLMQTIQAIRKYAAVFALRGVVSGYEVLNAANAAQMLTACDLVDMRNIFDVFGVVVDAETNLQAEVDYNPMHALIAQKKEFTDFKRNVEILRGLIGERKNNMEALMNLLAYQGKTTESGVAAVTLDQGMLDAMKKAYENVPMPQPGGPAVVIPAVGVPTTTDMDAFKSLSAIPDQITLPNGQVWLLVDQIEVLDKESEDKHGLAINDAKDTYRSRQKLKYPDGTVVEDTGRAHVGGYATYRVLNAVPGKPVIIIRRMDYVYGDYELEFFVNNKSVGVASMAGTDRINRWRNWPFLIPAAHVTESTLTIKQVALTAGRDVNMFHYWFFQPK
ncbi:MAG TPA: hypothetical protein VKE22_28545 [Haliangiales bacterium]|nr:hypothetical protein [Haliangiales bacterium]